jgi:hypothetical protein
VRVRKKERKDSKVGSHFILFGSGGVSIEVLKKSAAFVVFESFFLPFSFYNVGRS